MKVTTLEPHAAMPSGPGRHVTVLRRFDEEDPGRTVVQITLSGTPEQTTHPRHPDGTLMGLDDAIRAAQAVAESEGLDQVVVIDRTAGPREQEVLVHKGDHSVNMEGLQDTDEEDGERGPDMRDTTHTA